MIIIINLYQLRTYHFKLCFSHITITYICTIIYYHVYIYTHCIYTELLERFRPDFHAMPVSAYAPKLYPFAMLYIHILSYTIIRNVFIGLFHAIILYVLLFLYAYTICIFCIVAFVVSVYSTHFYIKYIYYIYIFCVYYLYIWGSNITLLYTYSFFLFGNNAGHMRQRCAFVLYIVAIHAAYTTYCAIFVS